MELEASFKFPWPYRVPTAALPKNKPCAQGSSSWFTAQQPSMALLEEETVATKPIKEGLPSSHQPRAAELSAGLDGCRALARLQGRVRQRQLTGHFFPSRILAIFSQLFYAIDIIRQWVYELKIKWALLKPLLLFCHLVNSLPELPCSYTGDTSLCPATAQEKRPNTSALQTACNNPPQLLHLKLPVLQGKKLNKISYPIPAGWPCFPTCCQCTNRECQQGIREV